MVNFIVSFFVHLCVWFIRIVQEISRNCKHSRKFCVVCRFVFKTFITIVNRVARLYVLLKTRLAAIGEKT